MCRDPFYLYDPHCGCLCCYRQRIHIRWDSFSDWRKWLIVMVWVGLGVGLFFTAVLLNGGFTQ